MSPAVRLAVLRPGTWVTDTVATSPGDVLGACWIPTGEETDRGWGVVLATLSNHRGLCLRLEVTVMGGASPVVARPVRQDYPMHAADHAARDGLAEARRLAGFRQEAAA